MAALTFEFDPYPNDVADAAERATWGRLSLYVHGAPVTRLLDRDARSVRDGVDGTLLPLAEWLARNWYALTAVIWPPPRALAPRGEVYQWRRTHNLRTVGQGTALPNLSVWRSSQEHITLWAVPDRQRADPYERVEFLAGLRVDLPKHDAKTTLADLVELALRRCEETAAGHPRTIELRVAWDLAQDRTSAAGRHAWFAAKAGLTWAHLDATQQAQLAELVDRHGDAVGGLAYAMSPGSATLGLGAAWDQIVSGLGQAGDLTAGLRDLRRKLPAKSDGTAWQRGWADAMAVRGALGVAEDEPERLTGVSPWTVGRPTPLLGLAEKASVIAWNPGRQPMRFGTEGSTFHRVRDTWAALMGGPTDQRTVVAIADRSPDQPIANAFATELLAPKAALVRLIGARLQLDWDEVEEIRAELQAPMTCVQRQIENHGLAHFDADYA